MAAFALGNHLAARRAERRNPPSGAFMQVDGVLLHYSDRGEGGPVVLIRGNAVSGSDWNTSGVAELLLKGHRVIIFDRPGFGYSERRAVIYGPLPNRPSCSTKPCAGSASSPGGCRPFLGIIVALALAEHHQASVAGLVLVSGYCFWTLLLDALLVVAGASPILGDLLRYTISPLFQAEYAPAMALRPSQIRATSMDGVLMIPARSRCIGVRDIIAGDGDKIVFKRNSKRLADEIKDSVLQIVEGAGHMVHHFAPRQVAQAIESMARAADPFVTHLADHVTDAA